MKFKILFLSIAVLLASCTPKKDTPESLLDHLLPNTAALIRINNMANFQLELKNSLFLSRSAQISPYTAFLHKIRSLDYLNPDAKCLLAFYEIGKGKFEYVLIADDTSTFFNLENVKQKKVEALTYDNKAYTRYETEDGVFYSVQLRNKIFVASSPLLIENLIRAKDRVAIPSALQKLYQTTDTHKSATIFIDLNNGASFLTPYAKSKEKEHLRSFSDWISLDLNASQGMFNMTGITVANDSLQNFVSLFKNTSPLVNKTPLMAPRNTSAILSYTFDAHTTFANNQDQYLNKIAVNDTIFSTVEEVGLVYLNKEKAVLLHTYGTNALAQYINENTIASATYQGSEIVRLAKEEFLNESFDPLITDFDATFCTILENTFVFASTNSTLQTIISNYKNSSTFSTTALYTTAKAAMANESSVLFMANASGIDFFLEKDFVPELLTEFKKANFTNTVFSGQIVADTDFYHANFLVSTIKKVSKANTVSPIFTLELDTDLATEPQFVQNHRTSKQEIVVQDRDNFLYLISTDGKVLWKKPLQGKIQGKISQVDIYKNGKLQLAFCTDNQFLILDRNGDEVPPFTKSFDGGNLNGLAVFDYEGSKNYRFVVTQNEKVFMYNSQGEIVKGFTYTRAESPIIAPPKHFKLLKKDYLVFLLENNTMKIRHRAGQDRVNVTEKIAFSNNTVFLYKNKFSVTDKKGILYQIDTGGKLSKTNFNLNKDHGMFATSKTLALMNDNLLSIKGKQVELELGVYTAPQIFYINDKIYVSVTDIQNKKIHLFDSQAKYIANFPVFGSSTIDMIDMDGDQKLELVTKDQENSIIVYRLN
ncbi:MAG: ribonuclease HII [Bacteroidota bacterium]